MPTYGARISHREWLNGVYWRTGGCDDRRGPGAGVVGERSGDGLDADVPEDGRCDGGVEVLSTSIGEMDRAGASSTSMFLVRLPCIPLPI